MEELLIENGLRATKARMEVLNVLKSNSMPLSADELILKINREVVSGSSVYRILSELEKASILKKTLRQNGLHYYTIYDSHEHYIVCSNCGKIVPITHCPISPYEEGIAQNTGFKVTGHILELQGICSDCQG
ncbi:MAG: Fur family transcriptional regulator [Peptoniphilus sp.]|uniref:Fur family transcriptional regulator n=1 Tax=Peptoniphilus sp. TaxID=1971214 RepID=UPI002A749E0D|nr:Fur family transcriptional regulator [Peptoniphilus sp.]MDY2987044.1 Fur family transcriptional regulator [Peptoniphilus sp.]